MASNRVWLLDPDMIDDAARTLDDVAKAYNADRNTHNKLKYVSRILRSITREVVRYEEVTVRCSHDTK